jgi:hypothetical protein
MLCNGGLQRLVVIQQRTGTLETSSNNLAFRASRGRYMVIVQVGHYRAMFSFLCSAHTKECVVTWQDDMEITEEAWNSKMSAPARIYDNVVGVGARTVHNFATNILVNSGDEGVDRYVTTRPFRSVCTVMQSMMCISQVHLLHPRHRQ